MIVFRGRQHSPAAAPNAVLSGQVSNECAVGARRYRAVAIWAFAPAFTNIGSQAFDDVGHAASPFLARIAAATSSE